MPTLPFDIALLTRHEWTTGLGVLLLKATLVLVVAFAITQVMQRASAGTRHLVWLVALVGLLAVPVLTAWAPLEIPILPAPSQAHATTAVRTATVASHHEASVFPSSGVATIPDPRISEDAAPPATAHGTAPWQGWIVEGAFLVLAIWISGVLVVLTSLTWSALVVRRIVRRAHAPDGPAWRTILIEAADRLGLDEPPRLLVSPDTQMPFGCGALTPVIVLPEESASWSLSRRRAVLLHELAHVRRRDLLAHMLGRVACACYWFHPLVWVAAKRLRSESERACDDLAVTCGTGAADYAEHLLDIVTTVRARAVPTVALAMARRKEFEGRVLAILDPELPHSSPRRGTSAALIAVVGLSAGLVAAAAPVPRARVQTPASPLPPVAAAPVQETTAASQRAPNTTTTLRRADAGHVRTDVVTTVITHEQTNHVTVETMTASPSPAGTTPASGLTQPPDDRPTLLAKVLRTDSSASLRRIAAWGLRDFDKSQAASDALVNAVRHDTDPSVREMSAWSLSNYDDQQSVIEALSAALRSDHDARVRATAAWALGDLNAERAADALTAALSDSSEAVKTRAAWALGNADVKQAPPALIALLRDPNSETRQLAAWALYQIQDPTALPALETALHGESNEEVQLAYLRAIAVMGDKSVDVLRGLLESPDKRIKSMAVRALAGGHASGPWPWPWPEPRPDPESDSD